MPIATTKYHKNNSMQVYQLSNLAKYTHELLVIFYLANTFIFCKIMSPMVYMEDKPASPFCSENLGN